MSKIFVTGYSGNIGGAVANYFVKNNISFVAGVRTPHKYNIDNNLTEFRKFDLEIKSSYEEALVGVDKVFLVRPPQLTDVDGVFKPFIEYCEKISVKQIVFLSLLGVEKNPFPPHHKIEKLIKNSSLSYTFIRPSFFMQNLIEPHAREIRDRNEIYIPSGNAKISFVDAEDIGEIIGKVMIENEHLDKCYTITGSEAIDYYQVARIMSSILDREINYTNPGLLRFRKKIIQKGTEKKFANVMTVLYLTTRLGMANHVTNTAELLLGRKPNCIDVFIDREKSNWI